MSLTEYFPLVTARHSSLSVYLSHFGSLHALLEPCSGDDTSMTVMWTFAEALQFSMPCVESICLTDLRICGMESTSGPRAFALNPARSVLSVPDSRLGLSRTKFLLPRPNSRRSALQDTDVAHSNCAACALGSEPSVSLFLLPRGALLLAVSASQHDRSSETRPVAARRIAVK